MIKFELSETVMGRSSCARRGIRSRRVLPGAAVRRVGAALLAIALAGCATQTAPKAPDATEPVGPTEQGPSTAAAPAPEKGPSEVELIDTFFHALDQHEFGKARAMFDERMSSALTEEKLGRVWASQAVSLGALRKVAPDAGADHEGVRAYLVELSFEHGSLSATLALHADNHQVAGLFFRPGRTEGSTAPYANPASFHTVSVSVGRPPFVLSGSLTLPVGAGPFPGLVLVHGSGPLDRDETVAANKPFKDLAEGLATRGIAALRYDKRTFQHGARLGKDISVDDEVVLDAIYALKELRTHPEIDARSVFIIGHSLGARLAPEIAERAQRVAGLVLLAPPGRLPWDSVVDQMRYLALPSDLVDQTQKAADEVAKGSPSAVLLGAPGAYWRDLAARDALATSRRLKSPLLILRGERDYQVTDADIAIWRKGVAKQPGVSIEMLPNDNHLFVPGTGKPGPAEYATPGHVDEAVITRIAAFIHQHASKATAR